VVVEVPIDRIVEKEVVKEVPVEKVVVKEVPVEKIVKEVVEVEKEVVKEVPVEVVVEKEVVKVVEVEKPVVVKEREYVIEEVVVVATPVPGAGQWKIAATSPDAKWGGHAILAAHGPPAHFDFYATGTVANVGAQMAMFDMLVRHDPRDRRVPIVPDLAHRWEISPDGLTYTFHLREGVRFHDGHELTSEDVKATFDRIAFPPADIVSVWEDLWFGLDRIEATDDYTIEFGLNDARSAGYMMQLFAMGYNGINKKETLDETGGDLKQRDNPPGTGPFKYSSRDTEKWIQIRNEDYWNEKVPYLDQITRVAGGLEPRSGVGDPGRRGGLGAVDRP
jgi:hypothetical protein